MIRIPVLALLAALPLAAADAPTPAPAPAAEVALNPEQVERLMRERHAEIEALVKQDLAAMEAAAAAGDGVTMMQRSVGADGVATTYRITTRDGRPWLDVVRDGTSVFSGPVGTAEERARIPEELVAGAQGLGLDFDVQHEVKPGGSSLRVRTGGTAPATVPQ